MIDNQGERKKLNPIKFSMHPEPPPPKRLLPQTTMMRKTKKKMMTMEKNLVNTRTNGTTSGNFQIPGRRITITLRDLVGRGGTNRGGTVRAMIVAMEGEDGNRGEGVKTGIGRITGEQLIFMCRRSRIIGVRGRGKEGKDRNLRLIRANLRNKTELSQPNKVLWKKAVSVSKWETPAKVKQVCKCN